MQFDQMPDSEKQKVTFEVNKDVDFHEGPVAAQALGIFVADGCHNREAVMPAAKLGVVISKLKFKETVDGETTTVATKMEMDQEQAVLLDLALTKFVNDTPTAVTASLNAGNAVGCASRVVEAGMADAMQAQLRESFGLNSNPTSDISFGFSQS